MRKLFQSRLVCVFAAAASAAVAIAIACSSQSAKDVAVELANKLTDEMDFNNGTVQSGTAPIEHSGDSNYPQVMNVNGPGTLAPGKSFVFNVAFGYQNLQEIAGAVMVVSKYYGDGGEDDVEPGGLAYATKYISITAVPAESALVLTGTMAAMDVLLVGEKFILQFAVQKKDGTVGNYKEWTVTAEGGADGGTVADGGSRTDGGSALTCACPSCSEGNTCNGNPSVTFTPTSMCLEVWGSDANKCSGWQSMVAANYPDNPPTQFNNGTELSSEGCTITINCPTAAY